MTIAVYKDLQVAQAAGITAAGRTIAGSWRATTETSLWFFSYMHVMKSLINDILKLQLQLPLRFNKEAAKLLKFSLVELMLLMLQAEEEEPVVRNMSVRLLPSVILHLEIAGASVSWKNARLHFVEARRQLNNFMSYSVHLLSFNGTAV